MIEPRLGLALMALCVIAFILVEWDRQRRIATMGEGGRSSESDAGGDDRGGE